MFDRFHPSLRSSADDIFSRTTDNLYSLHEGLSPNFKSSMPVTASNAGEIEAWNAEISRLLTGHVPEPIPPVPVEQAQFPVIAVERKIGKHRKALEEAK